MEILDDVILNDLWLSLPYKDISLCRVNSKFNFICQSNRTWQILLKRDFNVDYHGTA
jgi:hypothetical protein